MNLHGPVHRRYNSQVWDSLRILVAIVERKRRAYLHNLINLRAEVADA